MERQTVESSFIKEIGWEGEILEVEFSNGSVYQYHEVSEEAYTQLIEAPSVGKEFHQSIKNFYHTEKIQ